MADSEKLYEVKLPEHQIEVAVDGDYERTMNNSGFPAGVKTIRDRTFVDAEGKFYQTREEQERYRMRLENRR